MSGFLLSAVAYVHVLLSGWTENIGPYNSTGINKAYNIAYSGISNIDGGYNCIGFYQARSGNLYINKLSCDKGSAFLVMQTTKPYYWKRIRVNKK